MNEITVYLTGLVVQKKLSHSEAESFLDYAYNLCLNGDDDEEIDSSVRKAIHEHLK